MRSDDELKPMLTKARRYLASAEILCEAGDYDSAVSRLYYAMFYSAEAALWSKGYSFSKHSGVIAAFGQQLVKPHLLPSELHRWLREAFDRRQEGDYNFQSGLTEPLVRELQTRAMRFLDEVERFVTSRSGSG
jgi:uncharacterized protein (UPF0332 family)